MGNFPILETLMLEIYITNQPEICVGVAPNALVCAKNFWADGVALRTRKVEKSGKSSENRRKSVPLREGAVAPGTQVWEIFPFFTRKISRST